MSVTEGESIAPPESEGAEEPRAEIPADPAPAAAPTPASAIEQPAEPSAPLVASEQANEPSIPQPEPEAPLPPPIEKAETIETPPPEAPADVLRLGGPRAVMIAVTILVIVNAVAITTLLPMPSQGMRVRGFHYLYDAGQHLAAGLVAAALVGVWSRVGPKRRASLWGLLAFAALVLGLAYPILVPDLSAFANRVAPVGFGTPLLIVSTLVVSLFVVAALFVGERLGKHRKPLFLLGVVFGIGMLALNHRLLRRDYVGAHFFLALAGTTLIASSLAPLRLPRFWPYVSRALPWALAGIFALFSTGVWPGNAVLVEMLKVDGSVVAPWLARLRAIARSNATIPAASRPWFSSRAKSAPVAPSEPRLLPKDGVVVLVTIDAMRADILPSKKHDARLPSLARLRDQSVDFTMARSNGSQTVYSLSSLFFGTYFSQQYWVKHPKFPHLFPQDDPTPRFPKYLADAGIPTVTVAPAFWFNNEYGVLGGFTEEIYTKDAEVYAHAPKIMDDVIGRIERQGAGPLFLYVHFLDAHAPYDRGGAKGTDYDRYMAELAYVDHEIGRLMEALDRTGLASRTALIVGADHGEAFGEHGATAHATNIYEEQIRIPLMMRLPSAAPRKVDAPVVLMDVGPTVLDLMGLPTPGFNMGQSLVPFLRGQKPTLHRPIIIEGRLKKALILDDGFKAIVDDRANTSELYDLKKDPGEKNNLYDGPDSPGAERIEMLRLFFDAHTIRKPGYTVPYRP